MVDILNEVLGPIALMLGVVAGAALLYFVVSAVKAKLEARRESRGGHHRR